MNLYRFIADLVLMIHLAYVLFIVFGLAVILLGIALHWRWVGNFWFRMIHFLMIAGVVVESLLGWDCPLTYWEDRLREKAGENVQQGWFIARWIHEVMFWEVPPAVIITVYCLFGLAVLIALILAPPRWPRKSSD